MKSTATISAIIAVAVVLVIVYILALGKGKPVVEATPVVVPEVVTTEVPADGEPATVTEVKPMLVTPSVVAPE